MELKDVILSTLAEMEEEKLPINFEEEKKTISENIVSETITKVEENTSKNPKSKTIREGELIYLNSIRERLLVLFEGFQAPNNTNIEAKIDMTLNFLEYTLATIDERIENLERGNS
ncbi:FIG00469478: hypothetical protein [hydrothermal vent metagenome]|uniref:Campylobacter invasion antigen D C-terminal domain-containing protein n=1 Tax=hydrothermal vent metagenome TaxID=652676 RepID=A0A1W1CYL0_9ZZZZ